MFNRTSDPFNLSKLTLWWETLDFSLQMFYSIGILAMLALVVQMCLGFVAGDDHDGDVGHDSDGGTHYLSVRTVAAFFFAFGWTGVIAVKNGLPPAVASVVAMIPGFLLATAIILLMKALSSLASSGTFRLSAVVGRTATVYLSIPPAMSAPGEIQVEGEGRVSNVRAFTSADVTISTGSVVKISGMHGDSAVTVEPA